MSANQLVSADVLSHSEKLPDVGERDRHFVSWFIQDGRKKYRNKQQKKANACKRANEC